MKGAFLYVDAGKGHYVPAVALADAFVDMGHEAVVEDLLLVFRLPLFKWICKEYWRYLLRHPRLEKKVNKLSEKHISYLSLKVLTKDVRGLKYFKAWFEKEKPDFIISTNFIGATMLPHILEKIGISCPVYDYAADLFDQVKAGIESKLNMVYVPTDIGVEHTIRMGQPKETVKLCPFPLSKKFAVSKKLTKKEAREKLGLKNKFTILLNLGGEGIGSPEFLYGLVDRGLDVQVVVIGGKSKSTAKAFSIFHKRNPNFDLEMRGFVDNAQEYIMACDMQMGKAGANSLMESLYLKRPFLVSEVLYMGRSTQLFFDRYYCGWCEDDGERKLDIIEKFFLDRDEAKKIEEAMNSLPIDFNTKNFASMIISDTASYWSEHRANN